MPPDRGDAGAAIRVRRPGRIGGYDPVGIRDEASACPGRGWESCTPSPACLRGGRV